MKLIRVTELPTDFPFTIQTLYNWHYKNKYPGFLVKLAGSLCVDMDKIDDIITIKEPNEKAV